MRTKLAFDTKALSQAIRAGQSSAILASMAAAGLCFADGLGPVELLQVDDGGNVLGADDFRVACDAQPELATNPNAGIPAWLSNYLDPKIIEVLFAPMKAAQIAGETKKGDWLTTVATFPVIESTGETSAYGDYSNSGSVEVNTNFPQRQSFHYQTFTQWGEKEMANAGLAKIDWSSRLQMASALLLNKYQNQTYFFGVAGLQNYGLLNDPTLYAPIVPTVTWNSATGDQIYDDIRRLFQQVQIQSDGNVDQDMNLTLAMSPSNSVNLNKTNQFNVNVWDQVKKNFPKLRLETAVEYSTVSGELVQMIVDELEGQETLTAAYTEKMRAHAIVVGSSDFKQKKSQGTFGTIIFRSFLIGQMLG